MLDDELAAARRADFTADDRHNFGDLLFPHMAAPRRVHHWPLKQ